MGVPRRIEFGNGLLAFFSGMGNGTHATLLWPIIFFNNSKTAEGIDEKDHAGSRRFARF
jgi:hypothetical protein